MQRDFATLAIGIILLAFFAIGLVFLKSRMLQPSPVVPTTKTISPAKKPVPIGEFYNNTPPDYYPCPQELIDEHGNCDLKG